MLFQLAGKPGLRGAGGGFRRVWDCEGGCKMKREAIENAGYLIHEWQTIRIGRRAHEVTAEK